MQEEQEIAGIRKLFSFLFNIISMVWFKSIAAGTVITLLALVFNSDLEKIISLKFKYAIVLAIIMTLIFSTLIQISYNYYKKNLELESIAKSKKEMKLKKESLDFYSKFVKESTRVVYSPVDIDPIKIKKGTQVYDWEGILELKDFFLDMLGVGLPGVKSDSISEEQKRQNNLICIGGPMANEITSGLLSRDEIVYKFDERKIIDISNNKTLYAPDPNTMEKDFPSEDRGIITRMKNPYNPEKDAIILSGCFGWGTKACIEVLLNEENMKQLTQNRYFQVLCICNIDSKGVVHLARLEKNSLKSINY